VEIDPILRRRIDAEMHALAPPYRELMYARFVEGRTSVEIAERLGIPAVTVRTRLLRALRRLRTGLRNTDLT
jgi:RNA polymerase sigma factor (sigma-70 family)